MWVKIEAEAQATHGGNRSTYLRKLVEADLSERSDSDHKAAAIDYESSIETPILHLIRSRCAGIEHLYHKAYAANGGPPEDFDERLILSRLLEQALGLIAKHYEADFRVVTDIDLARLLEEAKDDDTFQERARRATDYVRRPESIAAAADHGITTQAERQGARHNKPGNQLGNHPVHHDQIAAELALAKKKSSHLHNPNAKIDQPA